MKSGLTIIELLFGLAVIAMPIILFRIIFWSLTSFIGSEHVIYLVLSSITCVIFIIFVAMKSFTRNEAVYKRKRMMKISGMDTMDIAQLKSRKFGTDEYECLRFELIKQKSAQQSDASAPSKPACLSLALGNKIV